MQKFCGACLVGIAFIFGFVGSAAAAPWVIDFDNGVDAGGGSVSFVPGTIFFSDEDSSLQRYETGIPNSTASVTITAGRWGNPDLAVGYGSEGPIGEDSDLEQNFTVAPAFNTNPFGPSGPTPVSNSGYGNILIVQEGGCESTAGGVCTDVDGNGHGGPDDEAHGGWLKFEFDTAVRLLGMNVFDTEEGDGSVRFYDDQGDLVTELMPLPNVGDRGVGFMTFNGTDGIIAQTMKVKLKGSGAIDNITGDTLSTSTVSEPAALSLLGAGLLVLGAYRRRRLA